MRTCAASSFAPRRARRLRPANGFARSWRRTTASRASKSSGTRDTSRCLAPSGRHVHLRAPCRAPVARHCGAVRRPRPVDCAFRGARGGGAAKAKAGARCRNSRIGREMSPRELHVSAVPETARLRDRIDELERLMGMRMVPPRLFGLTRREADMLGILLRRQVMTHAQLFEAIWGGDSERSVKIVEVVVCKLRAKLRPHGIAIRTEYGVGYFIPPDSKATARALIAAHERECA